MQVMEAGTRIGRFTLEKLLGRGGVAHVYLVRHNELGSLHGLKVLQMPFGMHRDRLLREGQVQSMLDHPNIVNVTDVVDLDGAPGLVMEFIRGPSLDGYLESARLSLDQTDVLGRGILAGVACAHERGLVHRDIKPGNILLAPTPEGPIPKITDFGLAKLLSVPGQVSGTRTGVAIGTPAYMAPEQIRDAKTVDARADVFSLGGVLYEMLAGVRPFTGADTMTIFQAVTSASYAPLHERIPERMRHAVEGALCADPKDRWPDAAAMAAVWAGDEAAPTPPRTSQAPPPGRF